MTESIPVENRKFPRIPYDGAGTVEPEGEGERCDVTVRDLSCEGVGLDLPEPGGIRPGTIVNLRFHLPDGPVALSARVVWVAARRAGLRLRLPESDPADKKAFGAWIAPRTKQALASKDG